MEEPSTGGTLAIARRPTASILSAYRQARRKMISIPSPPRAAPAPDLLADIMESQTLLHSKKSFVSVSVDGKVNIKIQNKEGARIPKNNALKKKEKLDLTAGEDSSKKAPMYPGHSRGGGYRGGYQGREYGNNRNYGNNENRNSYGGSYQGRGYNQGNQGNHSNSYQHNQRNSSWQGDSSNDFQQRRPHEYEDDVGYRNRQNMQRLPPGALGGGSFMRSVSDQPQSSIGPERLAFPIITYQRRHTFGDLDQGSDALDMRMAHLPPHLNQYGSQPDLYGDIEAPRQPTPPQQFEPLPEPPVFKFVPLVGEVEKSEDERSDSGLVIDTEKYDPTEPTHDESSGDEGPNKKDELNKISDRQLDGPLLPPLSFEEVPPRPIELSPLKVQSTILDQAVQQVIHEHRSRISSSPSSKRAIVDYKSDDDSEGDCPNFSIYSATSVNIANSSGTIFPSSSKQPEDEFSEKEEDLVQEDDDIPIPEEILTQQNSEVTRKPLAESTEMSAKVKTAQEEYEERLSRKCPITPNKRNPIKIKLNSTQTLIKRNVNLYADDEEKDDDVETNKNAAEIQPGCTINKENNDAVKDESPNNRKSSESKAVNPSHNTTLLENSSCDKDKYYPEKEDIEVDNMSQNSDNNQIETDDKASNLGTEYVEDISDDDHLTKICEVEKDSSPEDAKALDKMTESISESEDERSYTPCLDENKSKDTSLENEKENVGLEGLETEMISEEEGNEMFSEDDEKRQGSDGNSPVSQLKDSPPKEEDGEITEKLKELEGKENNEDEDKEEVKKKKRKKGGLKDKAKGKAKKSDITFKKLSKSSKERNYRDKDEKGKIKTKDRKESDSKEAKEKKREKKREKRKDMERYDVRNVVTEKRHRVKDAFGRDTSRPRTKSPSNPPSISPVRRSYSRSISKDRYTPSLGRKSRRSGSRGRKCLSPVRRPITPRIRKSVSPRTRLLLSPARRRSISPRIPRSVSPRMRRSISQRDRRSISPVIRRSFSPRVHRSLSPRARRSVSYRRPPSASLRKRKIRRSVSRKRSTSPRRRRSVSRGRKRLRSRSPKLRKSKTPRKKSRRSRSRVKSVSRNRSSKVKKIRRPKVRRSPKRKSPKPKKRVSRSITPDMMLSPVVRGREPPMWRSEKPMYREWSADSHSIHSRLMSPSWTPPQEASPEHEHLRVYLTNKDKSKRKEKKKRVREERDKQLRRPPDMGPSKEVFTSGNNILVSVSFNKDELAQNGDANEADLVLKKRKRKGEGKKDRKERVKRRRNERKDTENKKPVAIIDLEKSPFRELTPSPKNVIVLSDSDHEKDDASERPSILRSELREDTIVPQETSNSPALREPLHLVGPKTPPEPSVKFSIVPKASTQLRAVNPLHDEEEVDDVQQDAENEESTKEGTHKGPNTPPNPPNTPPSSPDAYDPFEPTKSGSATPEPEPPAESVTESQEKATITLETAQKTNLSADDVVDQRPITPIEKVMALLQSTRNVSPTQGLEDVPCAPDNETVGVGNAAAPVVSSPVATAVSAPVYHTTGIPRIGAYNTAQSPSNQRIVLPSPSKSSPLKVQPAKLFLAKPSPIKSTPIKPMPAKTLLKLPLPSVKPLPGRPIDLSDSPYSPGSSDFGDLFEPPMDGGSYSKPTKGDIFDTLFGSKSKKNKSSATKVPVRQIKHKGKTQVGVKIDEDSLKILDDLPSSAVEMQVKSKFLKKLNRQERVVEEVKLVLKPHYNKKHVTKEQYKDILRRAVPKICHNKTGEINPAKIQSLVEAYVKKCRSKNKTVLL